MLKNTSIYLILSIFTIICISGSLFIFFQKKFQNLVCVPGQIIPCWEVQDRVITNSYFSNTHRSEFSREKINEPLLINNTTREVIFCGRKYMVKQVILDGVDVVQRIAQLAAEKVDINKNSVTLGGIICSSLSTNYYEPATLHLSGITTYIGDVGQVIYIIPVTQEIFQIDSTTGNIYLMSAYGGSSTVIGKLR